MKLSAEEIMDGFKDNYLSYATMILSLVDLSAYKEPKEILDKLPQNIVEDIKIQVKTPPKTCNELIFLDGKNNSREVPLEIIELKEELQKLRSFAGAWRMHAYFYLS